MGLWWFKRLHYDKIAQKKTTTAIAAAAAATPAACSFLVRGALFSITPENGLSVGVALSSLLSGVNVTWWIEVVGGVSVKPTTLVMAGAPPAVPEVKKAPDAEVTPRVADAVGNPPTAGLDVAVLVPPLIVVAGRATPAMEHKEMYWSMRFWKELVTTGVVAPTWASKSSIQFRQSTKPRSAFSLQLQVTGAGGWQLATIEERVEHCDLHWGGIILGSKPDA